MYTDLNLQPISDNAQYVSPTTGNKYPYNYPKDEIEGLHKVLEVQPPEGKVVIGFSIDENFQQVWDWREKTDQEAADESRAAIIDAIRTLERQAQTPRRVREAILGIDNGWLVNQEALIAVERAKLYITGK